ncbi:small-conductance mechanosensitive channel [Xenococcus sp. PCC 7305]|uniref:mechanosensitive ion channel family protein n=1 Tax=Xenococcus sp. PCC 7305 TaxID=102125 RepID=UPI0002ABD977|nr:mechanosensitive ion channel domain-containing protein [Xenococcus sp. PCC 7305]ELS01589.1 small-conductance mechanosensitive channel [Xenococcus sp. PCC 7305]
MTNLTINIITIIAEVLLVFIFFFLVNWCFGRMYRKIFQIPLIEKFSKNFSLATIRRQVRNCIFFFNFILSLMIIGLNGYLIYRGENVREYSLQLFLTIPREFWNDLGLGIVKSIGVIIGASIALRIFNPLIDKLSQYVQDFDEISDNDQSIASFFEALKKNINSASWIAIAILCAEFLILPPIVSKYLYILLRIYLIISIGLLLFKVVAVIIDSLDALSVKNSSPDNILRFYDKLRHLISFLKRCLEYITYVFMATLCIQQIDFIANLAVWGASGIKLISILLISRILISVAYLAVEEFLLSSDSLTNAQRQRRQTITPLIQSSAKYIIYFGSGVLMLDSIGVDPGPILAGAGILGFAVGLGAQNLINDIVSGFLILFENYYLVGDYIETDEASGYVEAIELRTTRIRNYLGQVYIIRNGDINSITNFSKGFIYANVEVGVDYNTNLDLVQEIIEQVGIQLKAECEDILEPTQVEGIEEFGEIRLSIYTITKVKPGRHVQIKRIVRQVLKEAFDREGIYIPIGEIADRPEWVSKVQQEQGRKYRNRKPRQKRIINNDYSRIQGSQKDDQHEDQQNRNNQFEKTIDIKKGVEQSIEATAQIIREANQQTIISPHSEKPPFEKFTPESPVPKQLNPTTVHQLEGSSTKSEPSSETLVSKKLNQAATHELKNIPPTSESAPEKPVPKNKNQKQKQSKQSFSKQLKDNLKKFLENN